MTAVGMKVQMVHGFLGLGLVSVKTCLQVTGNNLLAPRVAKCHWSFRYCMFLGFIWDPPVFSSFISWSLTVCLAPF